jgi:hypothetical protein
MAYPGSPPKGPAPFEKAPLSPDDLERLATAFRPSWELDDAPFTGAGTLSAGDIRALQGGGTNAEVRATAFTAHASHAPAKPSPMTDDGAKVILDPGLTPPPPSARHVSERPPPLSSAGPWAASTAMPPLAAPGRISNRPPAPDASHGPIPSTQRITSRPGPRSGRALLSTEPSFASIKKSRTGLWLGGAAAAVVLVGGVMWLASGGPDKPVAAPAPTVTATPNDKAEPSIPPPPPDTVAANGATAPEPVAVRPSAAPPPVIAATALPQVPAPAYHAAMPAPAPHPAASPPPPSPAPKPATASRPKGPTIVRDVPF